jgi:hypothetical protein
MSKLLPVLHIGFNKAGSTTLQKVLFAQHPGVAGFNKNTHPNVHEAMFSAMRSCHRDSDKCLPFDLEHSRALWGKALDSVEPGKIPVYSRESLTRFNWYRQQGDGRLPARLYDLVGPARIVIMARNQLRILESLYITRTKGHKYEDPDEWFEARLGAEIHKFRYYAMAKSYADVFGRENVGVFLLEDMKNDVDKFAQSLCGFIGIDASHGAALLRGQRRNVRTSQRTHIYSKLRKRIGPNIRLSQYVPAFVLDTFSGLLNTGSRARFELPPRWAAEAGSHYRDDNRLLAADWQLPLKKYGYPI